MDRTFRDEDHIPCFDVMSLIADGDGRFAAQDVLLMFERVGMARHPASLLHGEFPQRKVGTFLRGDQDLNSRVLASGYIFGFYIVGMFDGHEIFLLQVFFPLSSFLNWEKKKEERYYGFTVFVGQGVSVTVGETGRTTSGDAVSVGIIVEVGWGNGVSVISVEGEAKTVGVSVTVPLR